MTVESVIGDKPRAIFIFCLLYALHMVEEFSLGFVAWANRYFGGFDWTQNLIGNAIFFVCLSIACGVYRGNPGKYLWVGMCVPMWVLSNAFLHVSSTMLGGEYSPGVVSATVLYVPSGILFLVAWGRKGLLNWRNLALSFGVGGLAFMLIPTFARAVHFHARLAQIFRLVG